MHRIMKTGKRNLMIFLETDRCTHSMEYRWLDLKKADLDSLQRVSGP